MTVFEVMTPPSDAINPCNLCNLWTIALALNPSNLWTIALIPLSRISSQDTTR